MAATAVTLNIKDQALACLNKLPPFSPILSKLLATLTREDVSFARISDLIEKDAVLSGNVLALVNSAIYGRRGRVNSVRYAVSLLGVAKLKNAALSMSITKLWNQVKTPPGWSMGDFNQHAIAVAILSDLLAQEADVSYPEGAFVAGLLHDLGALLLAVGLPAQYQAMLKCREAGDRPSAECERELFGCTIAELSAQGLMVWNLPEAIQTAVRDHELPTVSSGRVPLSVLVGAANQYVTRIGVPVQKVVAPAPGTVAEPEGATATEPGDLFAPLGLDSKLQRILDEFHSEFEGTRGFF